VQQRQLQVLGPEVVSPLRYAVRLVDGEECDLRAIQQIETARRGEAFGGHVEQVEFAGEQCAFGSAGGTGVERGVEKRRTHAELCQRGHLILHQGDQRRHHDARARPHQRRELVAQRLAAAGGHQHQRIAARHDVVDHGLLAVAERRVAEGLAQDIARRGKYLWHRVFQRCVLTAALMRVRKQWNGRPVS
jgi:hypothetical protein